MKFFCGEVDVIADKWSDKFTDMAKRTLGEVVDFSQPPKAGQTDAKKKSEPSAATPKAVKSPSPPAKDKYPPKKPPVAPPEPKTPPKSAAPESKTAPTLEPPLQQGGNIKRKRLRRRHSSGGGAKKFAAALSGFSLPNFSGGGNWLRRFLAIAAVLLLMTVTACTLLGGGSRDHRGKDPVYFRVRPGMSAGTVGDKLYARGIIDSKLEFWLKSKIKGLDRYLQVGNYKLYPQMTVDEVFEILASGRTTTVPFTIPEGYRVRDMAKRLDKEGIVSAQEFLAAAKDYAPYDYIPKVPEADYRIEGYLFPDTYEAGDETRAQDILEIMSRTMDKKLTPARRRRAAEMGLSLSQLVTLASLVEREAMYQEDRPIIARVFLNRLAIEMPLQSCATIQYLKEDPQEELTIADTKVESPYNTYIHYGLPPGPIGAPGEAAIDAVLEPADTDYLYFVADKDGHHHFSATYEEHLAAVDRYR